MKRNEKLTQKQVRTLQAIVLLLGVVFLAMYFFVISRNGNFSPVPAVEKQNEVFFQKQRLYIFGDIVDFRNSADRLYIHGDYILAVEPFLETTHMYSLSNRKKIEDTKHILLDYDGKNMLENKNGINTFFNDRDLQVSCSGGYIQNPTKILCIVPKNDDNLDNKLIAINPQTFETTDIYSSHYTLNYVSYIQNTMYIGGFNLQGKEYVLIVNGKVIHVPDNVSLVYKMKSAIYFGSLATNTNNQTESYYQIKKENYGILANLVEKGRIVF